MSLPRSDAEIFHEEHKGDAWRDLCKAEIELTRLREALTKISGLLITTQRPYHAARIEYSKTVNEMQQIAKAALSLNSEKENQMDDLIQCHDPRTNEEWTEKAPRFEKTHCSSCGGEFGPGDSGYSHCDQHPSPKSEKETP